MQIKDHKAVLVGGASGMARATGVLLAEQGAQIAILDLPSSDGEAAAAELGGTFHACNVMDYEGTEAALNDAVSALGGLHFVCNTAGGGIAKRRPTPPRGVSAGHRFEPHLDVQRISTGRRSYV